MREYTFKPAPLRKAESWAIKDGHLMRRGGAAALELSAVSGATWGEVSYRGTRNTWLNLTGPNGVYKLECNDFGDGRAEFLRLLGDVVSELEVTNPTLQVKIGYVGAARMAMFIIGVVGMLAGLVFLWAGISGNVKRNEGLAIVFGLGFIVLMAPLAWGSRPWGQARYISLGDLGVLIAEAKRSPM